MPTEHKKKSKTKEKKPAVLVKSEPQDIYPLAHYVDDKVELIRQIFTSLKTKTIHSITPDFLHVIKILFNDFYLNRLKPFRCQAVIQCFFLYFRIEALNNCKRSVWKKF